MDIEQIKKEYHIPEVNDILQVSIFNDTDKDMQLALTKTEDERLFFYFVDDKYKHNYSDDSIIVLKSKECTKLGIPNVTPEYNYEFKAVYKDSIIHMINLLEDSVYIIREANFMPYTKLKIVPGSMIKYWAECQMKDIIALHFRRYNQLHVCSTDYFIHKSQMCI